MECDTRSPGFEPATGRTCAGLLPGHSLENITGRRACQHLGWRRELGRAIREKNRLPVSCFNAGRVAAWPAQVRRGSQETTSGSRPPHAQLISACPPAPTTARCLGQSGDPPRQRKTVRDSQVRSAPCGRLSREP
jgi:hypothetical protein